MLSESIKKRGPFTGPKSTQAPGSKARQPGSKARQPGSKARQPGCPAGRGRCPVFWAAAWFCWQLLVVFFCYILAEVCDNLQAAAKETLALDERLHRRRFSGRWQQMKPNARMQNGFDRVTMSFVAFHHPNSEMLRSSCFRHRS